MKRSLLIFGVVGSLFFASCGDGNDRNDEMTNDTYGQAYETEGEVPFNSENTGTYGTTNEIDNTGTYGPTGNNGLTYDSYSGNQPVTGVNTSASIESSNRYVCTDSTLVSGI